MVDWFPRAWRELVLAALIALAGFLAGCNVIAMKQAGIERSLRDAGMTTADVASARVDGVRHLVLVDTPGRAYTREDYQALCGRFHVDHLGKVLVPRDTAGVETLLGLAYFDPPWVPGFALEQTLTFLYSGMREERVALIDALLRDMDALKARPGTMRARPFVVWGREDPVFPLEIGYRLAGGLGAPIRVLDHARHAPNLEHPEEFNRILRELLATGI